MEAYERTLPHNLEAEKSVLGAILMHPETFDLVAPVLTDRDFFRQAHGRIYAAMRRLVYDQHVTVDYVTLKEELSRKAELDEVGGPAYIAALTDGVPRSTNIVYYAAVVKEKATLRGLIAAANRIVATAYEAGEPAKEQLEAADRLVLALQKGNHDGSLVDMRTSSRQLLQTIEYRHEHQDELLGLDTGYTQINKLTFGWLPGDMIVVAARPSIGKTTFVMNSACYAGKFGKHVAVFSLEMRRAQLEARTLSHLSAVPLTRILTGHIPEEMWPWLAKGYETMGNLPIHIDDRAGQTVWDIRTACRRLKAEQQLDLVVIDYVQLMPGTLDQRGATRNEQVTDISRRVKELAGDCNVPVLLLSQLSRAGEGRSDPRPKLSDLRESGALEQDADLVCFLHRGNHREGGTTEFIVEKQRNGPTGTVYLTLDRDTVTFVDGGEPPAPAPTGGQSPAQKQFWKRRNSR